MRTERMEALPVDAKTGLTLPLSRSLGWQDLERHRAMIAVELEVLAKKTDRFGWDRDRGSMAHDRLILDWMDALQDFTLDEVKAACRQAVLDDPKRMPNEGQIVALIMASRKTRIAAIPKRDELPKPERVSPEAASEIMAKAGFPVRRFPQAPAAE